MAKYNYLKKRALYDLAVSYLDDVPVCSQCYYSYGRGYEWLTFNTVGKYVKFTVMNAGAWIKVVEEDYDGCTLRSEVLKKIC